MAIVTFYSKEEKETGQTLSAAALATYLAIEHNRKILLVSTNFIDDTLEACFWNLRKEQNAMAAITNKTGIDVGSGVEGLIKIMESNKISPEMTRNYTRSVFKDRLDVLLSPTSKNYEDYCQIANQYVNILKNADRYYDIIIVDLTKKMDKQTAQTILDISEIVILSFTQKIKNIEQVYKLRTADPFYRKDNVLLNIGRYDSFSKYSNKNVTRTLKEKKPLLVVPYNTLFFEAAAEGDIVEFFLRFRKIEATDRNAVFIYEVNNMTERVVEKLQELRMKM